MFSPKLQKAILTVIIVLVIIGMMITLVPGTFF